jgi:hypothetical protein
MAMSDSAPPTNHRAPYILCPLPCIATPTSFPLFPLAPACGPGRAGATGAAGYCDLLLLTSGPYPLSGFAAEFQASVCPAKNHINTAVDV